MRTILAITPEKMIMYNGGKADRHVAGTISEEELGERLSSDAVRMNAERARRGLESALDAIRRRDDGAVPSSSLWRSTKRSVS